MRDIRLMVIISARLNSGMTESLPCETRIRRPSVSDIPLTTVLSPGQPRRSHSHPLVLPQAGI
jgi:hypothetical protein